jgi:serine/threonine protein kinase/WD40 repeat protein
MIWDFTGFSMPITLHCPNPNCRSIATVPDSFAGKSVKCKRCSTPFIATPSMVETTDAQMTKSRPVQAVSKMDQFQSLPVIFGRYRVLKKIGQGGMGAVFQAEDTQLGRRVALKLPSFGKDASPARIQRFVREARSSAVLQHRNICTVYDAGEIDGQPFIAMAMIDGKELEDSIDPEQPMDPIHAATLTRKIALALAHAHGKGIVHRDLKPANVMIRKDGEPVVMDFGLAKRFADEDIVDTASLLNGTQADQAKLTHDGAIMGTPSYMSPEQVKGEVDRIGPASDIYSMGVMLFEMLTGNRPYSGNLATIMGQILKAPVPPLSEFRQDVDPRLNQICQKAMAKDVSVRFASMAEFATELSDFLDANMVSSSGDFGNLPTIEIEPTKQSKPNRAVLISIGMFVLFMFTGILILTQKRGGSIESPPTQNDLAQATESAVTMTSSQSTPLKQEVAAVSPADRFKQSDIPPETLRYISRGTLSKVAKELVAVIGETTNRLQEDVCWPAFTPDGKFLVVPSGNLLSILEWSTGKTLKTLNLPGNGRAHGVVISPDGKTFAVRYLNYQPGTTILVSDSDFKAFQTLHGYELPYGSQPFIPDGRGIMAFSPQGESVCLSLKDGTIIGKPEVIGKLQNYRETPSQDEMIGIGEKTLTVFSTKDFKTIRKLPVGVDEGNCGINFSNDKSKLLIHGVRQWEVYEWPSLKLIKSTQAQADFATFDTSGKQVWAGPHGLSEAAFLKCYDSVTGNEVKKITIPGQNGHQFFAFSPDRKWLGGYAGNERLRLSRVNTETGELTVPEIGHSNIIHKVAISPDGSMMATGSADLSVRLWDLITQKETRRHQLHTAPINWIWFSKDGKLVGSADVSGEVIISNHLLEEQCRFKLSSSGEQYPAFLPDGSAVVAGLEGGSIGLFDIKTGQLLKSTESLSSSNYATIAFHPDEKTFAVSSVGHRIRILDSKTLEVVQVLNPGIPGVYLDYSSDGKYLYSSHYPGKPIKRWDLSNGEAIDFQMTGRVIGMAIQPKGDFLATGGFSTQPTLWNRNDPAQGPIQFFGCVGSRIERMAFSHDGKHLFVTGPNGLVCIFRLPTTPDQIAAWYAQNAKSIGKLTQQAFYPPDELAAGHILAPDLTNQKVIYEADFAASPKDFPVSTMGNYPQIQSKKYILSNEFGTITPSTEERFKRETILKIPGQYSKFSVEIEARSEDSPNSTWYLELATPTKVFHIRIGKEAYGVSDGRYWEDHSKNILVKPRIFKRTNEAGKTENLIVIANGNRLDLFLDGRALCDPIFIGHRFDPAVLSFGFNSDDKGICSIHKIVIREARAVTSSKIASQDTSKNSSLESKVLPDDAKNAMKWWLSIGGHLSISTPTKSLVNVYSSNMEALKDATGVSGAFLGESANVSNRDFSNPIMKSIPKVDTWLHLFTSNITNDEFLQLIEFPNFTHISNLHLGRTKITDRALKSLNKFPNLTELYLQYTAITDSCIQDLESIAKLKKLVIFDTSISPEGVKRLRTALPNCEIISERPLPKKQPDPLPKVVITPEGRKALEYWISIGGTIITRSKDGKYESYSKGRVLPDDLSGLDQATLLNPIPNKPRPDFQKLKAFPTLPVLLNVYRSGITDSEFLELSNSPGLTSTTILNLTQTAITDNGISGLSKFSNLASLGLANLSITDAAIPTLISLTKLKSLGIVNTKITPAGRQKLQDALPSCRITFEAINK